MIGIRLHKSVMGSGAFGVDCFFGAALSVWSGMGKTVRAKKILFAKGGDTASIFANKKSSFLANTLRKNGDAFLKYGLQSSAYDFAHSKQKDYLNRTWGQHLGIFASGGTLRAASEHFFTNNDKWDREIGPDLARSGIGFASFAREYILSGFIKKRFDGAHRAALEAGFQKSYNLGRIRYWGNFLK